LMRDDPAAAQTGDAMYQLLKDTALGFIDDEALSRGAAIAFYTVTSLAPVLLVVIAIAGLVFGQEAAQGAILDQLSGLMGRQAADVLQAALASASTKSSGIVATIVGLVTLLATASGVFGEMQTALNRIWRAEPKSGTLSRLVRARAASLGLVAALGFLLAVSLVASAGLTALGASINARLPFGEAILSIVNFAVSLALLSVLFAAIYKVLPDRPIEWRDVTVGAVMTALLFTLGKTLIGWYLGSSAVASSYGAAGGLIVLFFWVYYSTQVFLVGAEFTKAYATSRGRGPAPSVATQQRPTAAAASPLPVSAREPAGHAAADAARTPLQRAERDAARHREALVRTVSSLEDRLSPSAMKRRVGRTLRRRPLQVAASVGAFTVTGFALAYLFRAERAAAHPVRRTGSEWR
jgi:membrane protein